MEHAKKYFIVPEERLKHVSEQHLSELDRQMHHLLKQHELSDHEKAVLYLQILQKYVTFHLPQLETEKEKKSNEKMKKSDEKVEENQQLDPPKIIVKEEDEFKTIENEIVEAAPLKWRSTARNIINFIQNHEDVITWTPSKEMVINGKVVANTNMVNLISHLLRDRKQKPVGYEKFNDALINVKFPEILVKNKYLKKKKMLFAKRASWTPY